MAKLSVSTREIGTVRVFDLQGNPTQDALQEAAWKIQRNIRRFRIQRLILNLQRVPFLDPLGVRKLIAACIRPQRSLIFGASDNVEGILETTYIPKNVRVCKDEIAVTEDLGPFLMERDQSKEFPVEKGQLGQLSRGSEVERRRTKRMHMALPLELKIFPRTQGQENPIVTRAIATNISEGGIFAEYLDLEAAQAVEQRNDLDGSKVAVHIFSNAHFPEDYQVEGTLNRKEKRRNQVGVAILFNQ